MLNVDSITKAYGTLIARGGEWFGSGGRIETSGGMIDIAGVQVDAGINLDAIGSVAGKWLIDPFDYVISGSAAAAISASLNTNDVTVTTVVDNAAFGSVGSASGYIYVNSDIEKTGAGTTTLTLQAHNQIELDRANISTTGGALNVVLWSDFDNTNDGGVTINGDLITGGGHVWISGTSTAGGSGTGTGLTFDPFAPQAPSSPWSVYLDGEIKTGGGDVLINAGPAINDSMEFIGGSLIDAGGGDITLLADSFNAPTGRLNITTTGDLTIQPTGEFFKRELSTNIFDFSDSTFADVLIGKSAGTMTLTLNEAMRFTGDFTALAPVISVFESLTHVGDQDGQLMLKAGRSLLMMYGGGSGKGILTEGDGKLDTILWGRSNETGDGGAITANINLETNGGHLWIGTGQGAGSFEGLAVGDGASGDSSSTTIIGVSVSGRFDTRGGSGDGSIALSGAANNNGVGVELANSASLSIQSGVGDVSVLSGGDLTMGLSTGVPSSVNVVTGGGDVTIASDFSEAGQGAIHSDSILNITTGGGNIALGGGADGLWFAYGSGESTATSASGVRLNQDVQLASGGGDISVRGISATTVADDGIAAGVLFAKDTSIDSGAGTIFINGGGRSDNGNSYSHGVAFGGHRLEDMAVIDIDSASTSADAIRVIGDAIEANGAGSGLAHGVVFYTSNVDILASRDGGGVEIRGHQGTSDDLAVSVLGGAIGATTGEIRITGRPSDAGGAGQVQLRNVVLGANQAGGREFSSSDITLTADTAAFATEVFVQTTGHLTIQPFGNAYNADDSIFEFDGNINLGQFAGTKSVDWLNIKNLATLGGLTLGRDNTTSVVRISEPINVNGDINIYGGSITVDRDLRAGGNLLLDADTGSYLPGIGNGVTINANLATATGSNGNITVLGRGTSDAASLESVGIFNQAPTVFADGTGSILMEGYGGLGTFDRGNYQGYSQNQTFMMTAGGGVTIRGTGGGREQAYNNAGVTIRQSNTALPMTTIQATGAGEILVEGLGGGGTSTVYQVGVALNRVKLATEGGQIEVSGIGGGIDTYPSGGLTISNSQIGDPASGNIIQRGDSGDDYVAGISIGDGVTYGGEGYAGDITLHSNLIDSELTSVITSGDLRLLPLTPGETIHADWKAQSLVGGLTIGGEGNRGNIFMNGPQTVAGPIEIHGQRIDVRNNLESTGAGAAGSILLKAVGDITIQNGSRATTNGGDITLWSDSDGDQSGGVSMAANTMLDSRTAGERQTGVPAVGGGQIQIAGGLDDGGTGFLFGEGTANDGRPDGFASNYNGAGFGIMLGGGAATGGSNLQILSGGGNINITGFSDRTSNEGGLAISNGIVAYEGITIDAGLTGALSLIGQSKAVGDYNHGLRLAANGEAIDSVFRTHDGDLYLAGVVSGSTLGSRGITASGPGRTTAMVTGTGDVNMVAVALGGDGRAIELSGTEILAASGNISLLAVNGSIHFSGDNFLGATDDGLITDSTSNISLRADRIVMDQNITPITTGMLSLQPNGGTFTTPLLFRADAYALLGGLSIGSAHNTAAVEILSDVTVNGNIEILAGQIKSGFDMTSTGGDISLIADRGKFGTFDGAGIDLTGNLTTTGTGNHDIELSGRGGNGVNDGQIGVRLSGSTITAGGDGSVLITGFGGDATGGESHHGIALHNVDVTAGGDIELTGFGSLAGSVGLTMADSNLGQFGFAGNVTLRADSMSLQNNYVDTAGAVVLESVGESFSSELVLENFGLSLSSQTGSLRIGRLGNTSNLRLGSYLRAAGDVELHGHNVLLDNTVWAPGNRLLVTGSGLFSGGVNGNVVATELKFDGGGNVDLTHSSNDVRKLAFDGGELRFATRTVLTVGEVDGLAGVNATGPVDIRVVDGGLYLMENVTTADASANALTLVAHASHGAGSTNGTNITLADTATISVGAGGRGILYTGRIFDSQNLIDAVGGAGSGRFRFNSDEVTTNYTLPLGEGLNIVYRSPSYVHVLPEDATSVYGTAPTLRLYQDSSVTGETLDQIYSTLPTIATVGNLSTSGHASVGSNQLIASGGVTQLGHTILEYHEGELTVTPKTLTYTGSAQDKIYDGTTTAPLTHSASGMLAGDLVTLAGDGAFASRNVGTDLAVAITNLAVGGVDGGNYAIETSAASTADITPATLTVTAPTVTKVYDGNVLSPVTTQYIDSLTAALVAGDRVDSLNLRFDDKNVGTDKLLIASDVVIDDGNGGLNYQINIINSLDNEITRLDSVEWIGGQTGDWSDPANWAGGAIPDLDNVANVTLGPGVNVTFDDSVAGPTQLDSLRGDGLTLVDGVLNVVGDATLETLDQTGGQLNAGNLRLKKFGASRRHPRAKDQRRRNGGSDRGIDLQQCFQTSGRSLSIQ